VHSELATPKDWLEKGTVVNYLKDTLDETTILDQILKIPDTQLIKKRKQLDMVLNHPMTQNVKLAAGYMAHADYLEYRGDAEQAALFRKAAASLEAQFGAPPPGQGAPAEASRITAEREAGASPKKPGVSPEVVPSENFKV